MQTIITYQTRFLRSKDTYFQYKYATQLAIMTFLYLNQLF